jgi:hypothetical protein
MQRFSKILNISDNFKNKRFMTFTVNLLLTLGGIILFKISEISEMLGVEKTEIFEKMITHKELLDNNIKKVDGVTYFDERGVEILRMLLLKQETPNDVAEVQEELLTEEAKPKRSRMTSKFDRERNILYDKMEILKNELFNLDTQLEMKDEMILKYQTRILQDMDHINKLQYTLMKKYEKSME